MSTAENSPVLDLYIGPKCSLCEDAKAVMLLLQDEFDFTYRVVNIYDNDQLLERFQLMIPVIATEGECLLYGKFFYSELACRLLEKGFKKKD